MPKLENSATALVVAAVALLAFAGGYGVRGDVGVAAAAGTIPEPTPSGAVYDGNPVGHQMIGAVRIVATIGSPKNTACFSAAKTCTLSITYTTNRSAVRPKQCDRNSNFCVQFRNQGAPIDLHTSTFDDSGALVEHPSANTYSQLPIDGIISFQ